MEHHGWPGHTTAAEFAARKAAIEGELAAVGTQIAQGRAYLARARDHQALWEGIEAFYADMAQHIRQYTEYTGLEHFAQRQRAVQALIDAVDVSIVRYRAHSRRRTFAVHLLCQWTVTASKSDSYAWSAACAGSACRDDWGDRRAARN
jgi:hypothetical protein